VLDLSTAVTVPSNEAASAAGPKIKHLARVDAAFAQSYPQIWWASGKVLSNQSLAVNP
jgi:hypothetical protein